MNQKKVIPTWLSAVFLILVIACIAWNIGDICGIYQRSIVDLPFDNAKPEAAQSISKFDFKDFVVRFKLDTVSVILASIAALVYCLAGYKKEASIFFKTFVYLFVFYAFVTTFMGASQLFTVIEFGLLCALALSFNLGKTRSYIYTGLLIICSIVKNIILAVDMGLSSANASVSEFLLVIILGIMVYAKYQDKAARGTN